MVKEIKLALSPLCWGTFSMFASSAGDSFLRNQDTQIQQETEVQLILPALLYSNDSLLSMFSFVFL